MPSTTVTEQAARYTAQLSYDDLPPDVIRTLKALLLDTLGTALAAGTLGDGCSHLVQLARNSAGPTESSVLGFAGRYPAMMAALVNGGLAHALNYDAVGDAHLGLIPPAPLALAEREKPVSGRRLLAALAAGCELSAGLGSAIGSGHPTTLLGQVLAYFGATAACGRILQLSTDQMHSALGLALMQAAGVRQIVIEGDPPSKAIYGAFPSQAGVLSALLAQSGLDGACDALGGEAGLSALVARPGRRPPEIRPSFGDGFRLLSATFKPWPVSGHVTPFVEAASMLVMEQHLAAADVRRVRLVGNPAIRSWFEPSEKRRQPETAASAANSIYFAVAKILVNGRLVLGDFTQAGLRDAAAIAFTDRMAHDFDGSIQGGMVEIETITGSRYVRAVTVPLGHPSRPMSPAQLQAKFRDCAGHAAWPIPAGNLDAVIAAVDELDELPDVSVIPALLCPPDP